MRNRTLAALVVAEVVSGTGAAFTFVALPWFVLVTSHSTTRTGLVLAVEILPVALLGIPSGSVVSRLGARVSMLVSDLVRAPLIALVPVLHWTGQLSFGVLLAIVFLVGVFIAPYASSQRSIIPELFGDDATLVTKAQGLFTGAAQLPLVVGPAIAGVLIGWIGTPPLLLIDGATFLFSFVVVATLVRGGARIVADEESRGVLAGVRYLVRDRLLGPVTLTIIVLDGSANAVSLAVPLLAYTRYDRNPHVAGLIFTGFGVGILVGSIVVVKLLDVFRPMRLACVGIVLVALPLWTIVADVPWPAALGAVVVCGLFIPLVNAPMMGLLTTRPPAALRAKVLTAVMAASGLGGPVGRLLVIPVFDAGGNAGVWILLAGGISVGAALFLAAVFASGEGAAAPAVAAPALPDA